MNLARKLILIAAALLALLSSHAHAQIDLLDQINRQQGSLSEVAITIESVGLNNAARPGQWTGIRLRLTDRGVDTQREVLVRVVLTDIDGDDAQYETIVTTNPGIDQPLWTYARLPFDIAQTAGFLVQAFEAEEANNPDSPTGFIAGKLLGQTTYRWTQTMGKTTGLIAIVGNAPGGINGYSQGISDGANPLGHEVTQAATLKVNDLPDRWMGLAMVREIIWNGEKPAELRIEQVRALREWIERGGHLIIILPAVGQDWLALGNRELAALLPRVEVNRHEAEPLSSLRPLLTDELPESLRLSDLPVTLHTFTPLADAAPGEADRILNDAQGRCVVASRSVGIGAVTLIGIPGWHRELTGRGLPEADVFWHRVLGKRGHIATQAEFDILRERGDLITSGRPARTFDIDIPAMISKSGRSLAGVMLGLIVFVIYWIVAGPGGFALLKHKRQAKHAWVAFVGASILFTALAWGGATALRPKRVEISHLSFVDYVYGQRIQRVRTWASILVPVYGNASVWLESDDAESAGSSRFVQTVAPWEPPKTLSRGAFPDARDYPIDSRSPNRLTFPARATVKQVQLDWAGGLAWQSIRPVTTENQDPLRAIRFTPPGTQADPGKQPPILQGTLIHDLPGTLEHVQVIVFRRQIALHGALGKGTLLTTANAWSPQPNDWQPGIPLDLSTITSTRTSNLILTLDNLIKGGATSEDLPDPSSRADRFTWLAFFNLLGPPTKNANAFSQSPVARREATHALDLSRWSTRPCLVIIGTLNIEGKDSMPEPFGVATNGTTREPRITGTTIVRWVYPLPDNPPDVPIRPQNIQSTQNSGAGVSPASQP